MQALSIQQQQYIRRKLLERKIKELKRNKNKCNNGKIVLDVLWEVLK